MQETLNKDLGAGLAHIWLRAAGQPPGQVQSGIVPPAGLPCENLNNNSSNRKSSSVPAAAALESPMPLLRSRLSPGNPEICASISCSSASPGRRLPLPCRFWGRQKCRLPAVPPAGAGIVSPGAASPSSSSGACSWLGKMSGTRKNKRRNGSQGKAELPLSGKQQQGAGSLL